MALVLYFGGEIKRENLKRVTRGPVVRREWGHALSANQIPDACMSILVGFMVGVRMMFGVVVGPVLCASIPFITKLVLRSLAMEPPEAHIHHLAPAWDNSFIGNPCGGRVIHLDRAFRFGPTHVNEGLAKRNCFSSHDKERRKF
jgi:hypothetical protein